MADDARDAAHRWWREGVLYQIYPRSWRDSNGDGVGDLRGIVERLDHLVWLGVDGIWLNPVTVSPNADWGYDVADYCAVDPVLGTLADIDELIAEAARRDIKVLLDLVPNHTSSEHPWFVAARASRGDAKRDWYVWADPRFGGGPPNNWRSTFGGPAWTLDERTGQYYLHLFLDRQPDLNWWNEAVRDEFDRVLRFWFDRGVAGFRIDVAHAIVKDRFLRDNPEEMPRRPPSTGVDHYREVYSELRPEVHDVHRRWRRVADAYDPPRLLVGETFVDDVDAMASFYGDGADELHLAFNIPFLIGPLDAGWLRAVVERTEAALPPGAWPVWTLGNHDVPRFPTRWADGDAAKARCALMMLLTLRGTAVLYYGDELGMRATEVSQEHVLDPIGLRFPGFGRDPERTPMPWTGAPGAGFTDPGVEPWLPFGELAVCNVADQRRDPDSMLSLARDLIQLRAAVPDLRAGPYETLAAGPGGLWAWRRGARVVVALNLDGVPHSLDGVRGIVRVGTCRTRDGERVEAELALDPWEGAVVWLDGEPRPPG